MTLKSRLSRLQTQAGSDFTAASPQPAASPLRNRLARLRPEQLHGRIASGRGTLSVAALAETLGGEFIAEDVIRVQRRIPLTGRLGKTELASIGSDPWLPGETGDDTTRHMYIDTETTGLSGGSGTVAFLIGVAVINDAAIELTQFLLTRFAAEMALLTAFAESLSVGDRLVSYNGKSYDVPLLLTRFRMQSLTPPFDGLPHLDLLHPVRRLFGRHWDDCRLTTLEQNLLGFSRSDDLPGSEAPMAWFDFVRTGQGERLVRVVDHNRQDIVSLAVAHSVLAQAVAAPRSFGMDLPALARWLAEQDEAAARELLEAHAGGLCRDGRRLLGLYCRRAGDWPQAVVIWEGLAATGCADSLERLAKYHEHISKNLAAARRCCERLPADPVHEHRRRRLDRKLSL